MKKLIFIILLIVAIVLIGTWPLSILGEIFNWLGGALKWLAQILDFFGWNGLIGVRVHNINDMSRGTAPKGNAHTKIGVRGDKPAYFDDEADAIYDYINDDGYNNLGNWIEASAKKHDKSE